MNSSEQSANARSSEEVSRDGNYDQEYRFGRRPRTIAPFPFTTLEFARLLVLRSRIYAGLFAADDLAVA